MADVSQQPARKRQRRKESLHQPSTKNSKAYQGLCLWEDVLRAILAEANPFRFTGSTTGNREDQNEGDEVRAGPASDDLIKALQKVLVETEEASDVIMLAISRLSYEQLQIVQAILDKHGHQLLADFVHVAAYNTSDPFARCPVGDDPESWQQQRSLLRSAPLESMKTRRMHRMQKAKQAMGEHIWKVDQQRTVELPAQMAQYAQILAGKHWREVFGEEGLSVHSHVAPALLSAEATPHNAWQKAAGSAFRASTFARSSMTGARQSMAAASKAAAQAAQPDQNAAPGHPAEQQHPHTFTGLPPAFWQSERAALKAAGLQSDPGDSLSNPGKGSRSLEHHRTHMGYLSGRATPGPVQVSLDAILFAKVPGPWSSTQSLQGKAGQSKTHATGHGTIS